MTKKILIAGSLALMAMLPGCSSSSLFDRERPDEFAVTRGAPLTVPAQFDLPAPQAGATNPATDADTKAQVLDALFGTSKPGQ